MKIEVETIHDLRASYLRWNAWMPAFTFPLENLSGSISSKISLINISCQSTALGEGENLWRKAIDFSFAYLQKRVCKVIYIGENSRSASNRVRTYKGVLGKRGGRYLQKEWITETGDTIIGALVDLSEIDKDGFEELCFKCPLSFVVSSDSCQLFEPDLLRFILSEGVGFSGSYAFLSFENLVARFVQDDSTLMRFGGDRGDQEVSVQVFVERNEAQLHAAKLGITEQE